MSLLGLRRTERDPELPVRLGDPDGRPPEPGELAEFVERHLSSARPVRPSDVALEYARWKPLESITAAYRVELDHAVRVVVFKRYASAAKVATLSSRPWWRDCHAAAQELDDPLLPAAVLPDRRSILWSFPYDRGLRRGCKLLRDGRRVFKRLERAGHVERRALDPDAFALDLLRYRPEKRAVFRGSFPRTSPSEACVDTSTDPYLLAIRVVDHAIAERCSRLRVWFDQVADGLAPRLLVAEPERGLLFEEWRPGVSPDGGMLESWALCGAVARRLHGVPLPTAAISLARPSGSDRGLRRLAGARMLLDRSPDLRAAVMSLDPEPLPSDRLSWVHGDLHRGQYQRDERGVYLLDLDSMTIDDPLSDLASLAVDAMTGRGGAPAGAFEALLESYFSTSERASGERFLRREMVRELIRRAAGSLRRLARGAEADASRHLEYAAELST